MHAALAGCTTRADDKPVLPDPDCDPIMAPLPKIDREKMDGRDAPFHVTRTTEHSIDIRFRPLEVSPQEVGHSVWGSNCEWPLRYICSVSTTPSRPHMREMQPDGIGPGLGAGDCTFGQYEPDPVTGRRHHCHVYIYDLEDNQYLQNAQYHSWCMPCIGPRCILTHPSQIVPAPEVFEISTPGDLELIRRNVEETDRTVRIMSPIDLSNGARIAGYNSQDGDYVYRVATGIRETECDGEDAQTCNTKDRVDIETLPTNWTEGLALILDDGLSFVTAKSDPEKEHATTCATFLASAVGLCMYMLWSIFGIQKHVKVLHETGVATMFGMAVGLWLIFVQGRREVEDFSPILMTYGVLPTCIFTAGFNLRYKSFFRYLGYIVSFGLCGTVLFFFGFFKMSGLVERFATSARGVYFEFDPSTRLVLSAILSASDTVTPLTLIDPQSMPVVYSIVFGEAVLNDVVGVLLASGLEIGSGEPPSVVHLLLKICWLGLSSAMVGLVFGFGISWVWARSAPLQQGMVTPVALMMMANYLCYVVVELLDLSSIFAIFVSALISGHYAAYSLTEGARHFAREVCEMFAYLIEASLFVYFGMASTIYVSDLKRYPLSFPAVLFCFFLIVTMRFVVLFFISFTIRATRAFRKLSVNNDSICLVALSGMIRGTISFALIIKAAPPSRYRNTQEQLVVSTVLLVVNLTTFSFGCILPIAITLVQHFNNPMPLRRPSTAVAHAHSLVEMTTRRSSIDLPRPSVRAAEARNSVELGTSQLHWLSPEFEPDGGGAEPDEQPVARGPRKSFVEAWGTANTRTAIVFATAPAKAPATGPPPKDRYSKVIQWFRYYDETVLCPMLRKPSLEEAAPH